VVTAHLCRRNPSSEAKIASFEIGHPCLTAVPAHRSQGLGTHAELLLAFWASIGFKRVDFMTLGMNEKRTAWLCHVLGVAHPRVAHALKLF